MSGVRWTKEQLEEWRRKGRTAEESTRSIPKASSPSPTPSHPPSKPCSSARPKAPNKTEVELKQRLQALGWMVLEFQPVTLRLGLLGRRCNYTPDFGGCHPQTGKYYLIECKGPYVWEDARVKYQVAARWCYDRGIGFLLCQKRNGLWESTDMTEVQHG